MDVEITNYYGSTEHEKDNSCCRKCALNLQCQYWVRATGSDDRCWLKRNEEGEIIKQAANNRRGGLRPSNLFIFIILNKLNI